MRSLKRVRLVCKSWLLEAQYQMERRGIVRLWSPFSSDRIQSLSDTCGSKVESLPQTLQALDLDLCHNYSSELLLFNQILTLSPPLLITRFSSSLPFSVVIPAVMDCCSTLEYLRLVGNDCSDCYLPPSTPEPARITFPKLRHLFAQTSKDRLSLLNSNAGAFCSNVAWIANACPTLATFELDGGFKNNTELVSNLLMQVNIQNVKSFKLFSPCTSNILGQLKNIPFHQLQNFRFWLAGVPTERDEALVAVLIRSVMTLRGLSLLGFKKLGEEALAHFPICPNVQELQLASFPYLKNFASTHFPSLRSLTVGCSFSAFSAEEWDWSDISPLFRLKSLTILAIGATVSEQMALKFFETFPSLESLSVPKALLLFLCSFPAIGTDCRELSTKLERIKNLEINDSCYLLDKTALTYPSLAVLQGVETITVTDVDSYITTLPIKELQSLKLIQFPWGKSFSDHQEQLLELARGVKKVLISNCCSIRRNEQSGSTKTSLEEFFEAAPNAECGCKDLRSLP